MYVCKAMYVFVIISFLIFVVCSAEEDKPVVHIYDGRGCEKSAVTSLTHIHSSPIISMKVWSSGFVICLFGCTHTQKLHVIAHMHS